MPTDQERLVVSLEARIRDFEKNFQKANRVANDNFGKIEARAKRSGDRLERSMTSASSRVAGALKSFGGGFVGGILGGLTVGGLTALAGKLGDIAENVANIGSAAKRAGIDVKSFQELSYVAEQNRIDVDALTDGIKELQLRADEFITTGSGSGAQSFQRLGYSAEELKQKLKDPSALLVEIIGRLQRLDKAAQIRISDELFGGEGGEKFVQLLDKGADSIRAQIAEAHELGLVLDADVIQRADEIDRKFKAISSTIGTHVKLAVIDAVSALADLWDRMNTIEEQQSRTLGERLAEIGKRRLDIENEILKLRADRDNTIGGAILGRAFDKQIEHLEKESADLHETERRILKVLGQRQTDAGKAAKDATPEVEHLNTAIGNTGKATNGATGGLNSFTDAIRALKGEIPELADQLATLDARAKIDKAYRAALNKARSIGDTITATNLRDRALSALAAKPAREAAGKGILDLIGFAEGTDKGRGYNETLGYGKFTGGDKNLVGMTLDQIDALQSKMLANPANTFNSSALGRYQITQRTLRGLRGELGLSGSELFGPDLQDRLAEQLLRRRGNDVGGLRNEWEGLRRVDDATIRNALNKSEAGGQIPAVDPGIAANQEAKEEQAKGYADIIASAKEFTAEQGQEREAMTMTAQAASAFRHEQEMLNRAQQQGITLTPQQRSEIQQYAQGMAQAEAATKQFAQSQQQAAEFSKLLGNQAVDALTGILTGTMTAKQALAQLGQTLLKVALQGLLLGEGPLGGGGGGLLGKLFGGLLGLATGGEVRGPGTSTSDSIPTMLSDGEFVVNARATKKHRAALEAINSGRTLALASGGIVRGGTFAPSTTYSPNLSINVAGSGNPRQDARLASHIADEVDKTLKANQPKDSFRRSQPQLLGDMAMQLRRAGTRQL